MSTTATRPDFMTTGAYEEARDLPEAIRLNRAFIRHEREFCNRHFTDDEPSDIAGSRSDCLEGLLSFDRVLESALRIWEEEIAVVRARIAERIRQELPSAENYGDIASCVESGDYSGMAC